MVFTNAQTTAFFENNDQMGLAARTRVFLQTEGITDVSDLEEFTTKESWSQVLENCKRPPRIPDPAGGGGMIEDQAYRIGAKSLRRMKVAAKCVAYYNNTDRPLSAANMTWTPRLANFEMAWQALEEMEDKESTNKLPILHRNFPIEKWIESYSNHADQRIGVRMCPLSYVIRDDAAVPATAPPLEFNAPYSTLHGSVKNEMVARYSHTHALFSTDNGYVFDDIEEATRGSKYQATITPYRRTKDGRGAYMALKEQHTGPAMWDKKKTTAMEFLQSRKFSGTSSMTLESFLGQHRSAFVTLQRCSDNVSCQLPDERSRVQYLLDNIQVEDANVRAALSSIRMDDTPTGMRNKFEAAVAFLLPTDPVAKKQKNKRTSAEISAATGDSAPKELGKHKSGRGSTGVEFRYYEPDEFRQLSKAQKNELREHRKKNGLGAPSKGQPQNRFQKKKLRATISSAIKKELKDILGGDEHQPSNEGHGDLGKALIASLQKMSKDKETATAAISALAPAMKPKPKPTVAKPKSFRFAPGTAEPADGGKMEAGAEVAASNLMKLMRRISGDALESP